MALFEVEATTWGPLTPRLLEIRSPGPLGHGFFHCSGMRREIFMAPERRSLDQI